MNSVEDRLAAAARAVAETVPEGSAPPLPLPPGSAESLGPSFGSGSHTARRTLSGRLAPLAAAASIIAVIGASIAIANDGHVPGTTSTVTAVLRQAPRYFIWLRYTPPRDARELRLGQVRGPGKRILGSLQLVVSDTVTGATVATARPPRSAIVAGIAAAADDRTFVVETAAAPAGACGRRPYLQRCRSYTYTFWLARLDPRRHLLGLHPLAIPAIQVLSMTALGQPTIALSPDGAELAVALSAEQQPPARGPEHAQIRVYSLAGSLLKEWHDRGAIDPTPLSMSWGPHGLLAFGWWNDPAAAYGIWMLNTNAPSGSLLSASRLAVAADQRGTAFNADGSFALSGDGKVIATAVDRGVIARKSHHPVVAMFRWYSARTGYVIRSFWPSTDYNERVLWSNASGSVLVVAAPIAHPGRLGPYSVLGVLSGHRFAAMPRFGTQVLLGPVF